MTKTKSIWYAGAVAMLCAALLTIAPARAEDPERETASRVVSTAGIDFTSPQDQAILRHRLFLAAHHVCMGLTEGEPPGGVEYRNCFDGAMSDAWAHAQRLIATAQGKRVVASKAVGVEQ